MSNSDVRRLKDLAELILDHKLALLRKAASAKDESEAALAALARPLPQAEGLEGASAALAALAYQRWADARSAEINQVLARQIYLWLEARQEAQTAFGKAEALRGLTERQTRKRSP